MKRTIIILFLTITASCYSQVVLNPGIDTSSIEHKEILTFWREYLKSKPSKNSLAYLDFWNVKEKENFNQPDLTLHSINTEHSTFSMGYKTVLSILPYQNDFYQIKTAIGWGDTTNHISLLAITNHYVKKNNQNKFELYSSLSVNENIKILETEQYKIYTLKETSISIDTLNKLNDFILKLRNDHQIKETKQIKIIYGKNSKETEKIIGFDFNLMSSTNNPSSGVSDRVNDLIIINGIAVIFHETTHIYLNPLYTETPLAEGLATFYGGSMGISLIENIKFLNNYIQQHNEIDLYERLTESYFYIDNKHNPVYTLQGLLVQLAYDKGGINETKKLLSFKNFDEIFKQYFKIKDQNSIDRFLKSELKRKATTL
ncbi:MAG: hypothetical protein HND27_10760 [Bacteroidetes bacterium]|nr:hypothetical protein [Bacteroidota bacterium]NOG96242.1 hypothetical protein [Bacteroidota bacterium]